jgi:catalase
MKGTGDEQAITAIGTVVRLGGIAAVVVVVIIVFAYVGGWLSPNRMTQNTMVAGFEDANGSHPGFRLNHAKGLCVAGWFDGNGQASALSKAAVFAMGHVPLIGRISLAGGMPFQTDQPATVRSMALRLLPSTGEEWRTGTVNIPVFVVNSARGFYEQTIASAEDPATGKPNPEKIQAFLALHPETVKAMAIIKAAPISSGFADATYYALDAFRFVNAAGDSVPVRWSFVPVEALVPENAAQAASSNKDYLFDELIARVSAHPLQWRLLITIGRVGDPTDDATLPWPQDRQQVDAGMVSIDRVSSEATGKCADVNYDPLVLPSGIEPSDDPLLSARSAVYTRSFTLRAEERGDKLPSEITPQDVLATAK